MAYKIIAGLIGLVCYSGLIWFCCRLLATNHLDEDEQ